MAFTTLTNLKIILGLGPNRSILGTIIRPDPVLVERKGGFNGQVTFDSLLPEAGEPLEPRYDQHEILCKLQLDDDEPLPRGGKVSGQSSGKKRKSSSKDKSVKKKKKFKDKAEPVKHRNEENGYRKARRSKKTRFRHNPRDVNGFGRYVGS